MKKSEPLTPADAGRFTVLRMGECRIPAQIVRVSGDMCIFRVIDEKINLRSGQNRFDPGKLVDTFDTTEEALEEARR